MAKKRSGSSVQGSRRVRKELRIADSEIDFSDIPELSQEQLTKARRVGRPKSDNPKKLVALRISPKLLSDLRKLAKRRHRPYQSLLHDLLERAVKDAA